MENRFTTTVAKITKIDVYRETFGRVVSSITALESKDRNSLLVMCNKKSCSEALKKLEEERVSISRIMVALLPESFSLISNILAKTRTKWDFEFHFTLFCYLDQVPHFEPLKSSSQKILSLIEKYLLVARRDVAQSSWMAGDLLGKHWNPQESFPVLKRVLLNGTYICGRRGALKGFEELLNRDDVDKMLRSEAIEFLKVVIAENSPKGLKEHIRMIV